MYKKYFINIKIEQNNTKLLGYTGNHIHIFVYITVPAKFKNKIKDIKLFIAKQ